MRISRDRTDIREATFARLPSDPEAALAGIALASIGKFAVEAREHPSVRPDGELGAGVDAYGVSRRARTIDRERGAGQRDEGRVDRASGIELVHPRQPRVRRQHHSIGKSDPGIELSAHECRQRGHADRAVGRPSGPAAPAGTGFVSVKPFCQSSANCTAANGVTAKRPNTCFAPTSTRPLKRLLPKLPVAVSVGPMPAMLRVSLLRNVPKLSAPAA